MGHAENIAFKGGVNDGVTLVGIGDGAEQKRQDSLAFGHKQSVKVVSLLVSQCPDAVKVQDKDGDTPFHRAIYNASSVDIVSLLVSQCPDSVKIPSKFGDTPLPSALFSRSPDEVVSLLVSHYPDAVKIPNSQGAVPFDMVIVRKILLVSQCPDVVKVQNKRDDPPLLQAIIWQSPAEVISLLVSQCPEAVKVRNTRGATLLHSAIEYKSPVEVISLLLSRCPEAEKLTDHGGGTLLHRALRKQTRVDVVSLLVSQYPEAVKVQDKDQNTPLHLAVDYESPVEAVSQIVSHCPDAGQVQDMRGDTLFHTAICLKKGLEVALLLISQLSDADAVKVIRKEVSRSKQLQDTSMPRYVCAALAVAVARRQETEYRQVAIQLCGDSRVGKSTLGKSLDHCIRNQVGPISLPKSSVKEPVKLESTIGLEKQCISRHFGVNEYVLFDYGGQSEYVNHSKHLASGPGSVYVVVVGLAEVHDDNSIHPRGKLDEAERDKLLERYVYWLRFINSVAAPGVVVLTVLNFQSRVSAQFSSAVLAGVVAKQEEAKAHRRLRNLVFWKDVIVADVLLTNSVYSSSLFAKIDRAISRQKPSSVTAAVLAVRRFKRDHESWPEVVSTADFLTSFVLKAVLGIPEVRSAYDSLPAEEWAPVQDIVLTAALDTMGTFWKSMAMW